MTTLIREINAYVAEEFGLKPDELRRRDRRWAIVHPRFIAFKIANDNGNSQASIGRWYGKDHTTVRNGILRTEELAKSDKNFRDRMDRLGAALASVAQFPPKLVFSTTRIDRESA